MRAVLLCETLTRRLWPAATVALFCVALWRSGLVALLPGPWGDVLVSALAVVAVGLFVRGLHSLSPPSRAEALRRLDAANPGDVARTLQDIPAGMSDDPLAAALWRRHRDRARAAVNDLKRPVADLRLARRDPWAVRLVVLLFAGTALLFGNNDPNGARGGSTDATGAAVLAGFEGWITPPAYTGAPPVYLSAGSTGASHAVPVGSEVVLQSYAAEGLELSQTVQVQDVPVEALGGGSFRAGFAVARSGQIAVEQRREPLVWEITAIQDAAPTVSVEPARGTLAGRMLLRFAAQDDYGIVAGTATVTLDLDKVPRVFGLEAMPSDLAPLVVDLPMPIRGSRADFEEELSADLAEYVWAGLPARVTLEVRDARGQAGRVEITVPHLPGRRFLDPVAAAVAEQRRDLLWSPENDRRVLRVLRAILYKGEDLELPSAPYLMLRSATSRLRQYSADGLEAPERAEIAAYLWSIALRIEDGDLSDAAERLRRAQERLARALEQGASPEDLAELNQDLQDALQQYLRQLQQQAIARGDMAADDQGTPLAGATLQELLDRIEQLSRDSQFDEAKRLLELLQQLTENMQVTLGGPGQPGGEGADQLRDLLDRQQELADETFRDLQERGGNGGALSDRQDELRELLDRNAPAIGEGGAEALGRAERGMEAARDALREGDNSSALRGQAEAIDALRDGLRQMIEENQAGQGTSGGPRGAAGQDPLGRPAGQAGRIEGAGTQVPGAPFDDRARELLRELRDRLGDRSRPPLERDYIERLIEKPGP